MDFRTFLILLWLLIFLLLPVLACLEHAPLLRQARKDGREEDAIDHIGNIVFFVLWPGLSIAFAMSGREWTVGLLFAAIGFAFFTSKFVESALRRRLRKKGRKAA